MPVPVTLVQSDVSDPAVLARMQTLLQAAGADVALEPFDAHDGRVTPALVDAIRATGTALMGFQWGRRDQGELPPMVQLRKAMGVHTNVRPIRSLPGVPSTFQDLDVVIVRETTEDVYSLKEHESLPGVFEGFKVTTEATCARIARAAFEYARSHGRKKVTTVHKSNIMKLSDGLFLRTSKAVAAEYPDIEHDEVIVDALCMKLVLKPQQFDVLLTGNLYGDIVGDLCAGLAGGSVNTPSINYAPGAQIFTIGQRGHAVRGSDAMPMLLVSLYLLEHIGQGDARRRLGDAAEAAVIGGCRPEMIGGAATGVEFLDAVMGHLG
jgi:isocitrate dehydrogenase (NAD+)